jgi:hypothetical protein
MCLVPNQLMDVHTWSFQIQKRKQCTGRESNPGLYRSADVAGYYSATRPPVRHPQDPFAVNPVWVMIGPNQSVTNKVHGLLMSLSSLVLNFIPVPTLMQDRHELNVTMHIWADTCHDCRTIWQEKLHTFARFVVLNCSFVLWKLFSLEALNLLGMVRHSYLLL